MNQFFTQCPHCQTSFKIGEDQLNAAEGLVRCGTCLEVFSALDFEVSLKGNVFEQKVSPSVRTIENKDNHSIEALEEEKIDPKAALRQTLSQLNDKDSLETLSKDMIASIDDEPLSIVRAKPARSALMTSFLLFCNLSFVLALISQYVWANQDAVMANPRLQFATDLACQYLTCPEQDYRDLTLLSTDQLIIRSHPIYPEALQIDFIFSNQASFEQVFPMIEISFKDTTNRSFASRTFTPSEYLPEALQEFSLMPALSSIQVKLEIVDPGEEAINYSLTFK